MFSQHLTNDAIVRQHRDRLIDSATRHRLVFGQRNSTTAAPAAAAPALADIVALPARFERSAPRAVISTARA